jgi:hypothetical protein
MEEVTEEQHTTGDTMSNIEAEYATPAEAERAGREGHLPFESEQQAAWVNSVHALASERGFHIIPYAQMQESPAPEDSWASWHDALFLVWGDGWDDVFPFVFLSDIEAFLRTELDADDGQPSEMDEWRDFDPEC